MSVFYRDACPGISLHFSGVHQHFPFALSDMFGCIGACNMRGFALIYFYSPFLSPIVYLIDGGSEFH
jgi:hypothetical protein